MGTRRILVIESSADGGESLCALLDAWGHSATCVDSGRRGLRRALMDTPDVIILDLGLADMDGCIVVQRIRSAPTGGVPVVIAYSGYHHREGEALDAGCDAFVLKPQVEELEMLVEATREEARQFVETAGPAVTRRR